MLFRMGLINFYQNVNAIIYVTFRVTDIKRSCNVVDIVQICKLRTRLFVILEKLASDYYKHSA